MKCSYKKADGKKCKANAMHGVIYCFRHNGEVKEQAIKASAIGGHARRQNVRLGSSVRLDTPDDIKRLMEKAINSLWTGKMQASNPAGALGYMSKIFLEAHDKSELEKRLDLLEKRMNEVKT